MRRRKERQKKPWKFKVLRYTTIADAPMTLQNRIEQKRKVGRRKDKSFASLVRISDLLLGNFALYSFSVEIWNWHRNSHAIGILTWTVTERGRSIAHRWLRIYRRTCFSSTNPISVGSLPIDSLCTWWFNSDVSYYLHALMSIPFFVIVVRQWASIEPDRIWIQVIKWLAFQMADIKIANKFVFVYLSYLASLVP